MHLKIVCPHPIPLALPAEVVPEKHILSKPYPGTFKPDEVCLISQDHYYKPRDTQQKDEKGVTNFDLPEAIERGQFHEDILKLKRGESIFKKEYAFNAPNVKLETLEFRPAPILIVEGLFVQYFQEIEQELDLKIFIEAKDYLKLSAG